MSNPHVGSDFDDFLSEEGVQEEVTTVAQGRVAGAAVETFSSVWDAVADTPKQAASLQVRAELMRQIAEIIKANDWQQAEAAQHCGVTQPRINELLHGRVSRFSLDVLVNIATALGRRVHLELKPI